MTTPFCPDISEGKKDPLYFNFNVFNTEVITGDSVFKPPTGEGAAIIRGHPSHSKFEAQRHAVPSFLSYFLRP